MPDLQTYIDNRELYNELEKRYLLLNLKDIVRKSLSLIRPRANVPIIQWLEDNLVLPDTFPIPGPFRIKNSPHLREPLEMAIDTDIRSITLMGCTQMAKTLFFICVWAYDVCNDPCPYLYANPTDGGVKSFALQKLEPVINASPILRKTVAKKRRGMTDDSSTRYKLYPGGWMEIINLQSPGKTRQRSVKKIVNDDTDEIKITTRSEGSPHTNLESRTTVYKYDYKHFHGSTPRLDGSSFIQLKYEEASQANFYVRCPSCKKQLLLNEDNVVWDKEQTDLVGHSFDHRYETARVKCEHCSYEITERERIEILQKGKWIHKKKSRERNLSYQLGKASSSLASLEMIARAKNEAERASEGGDDSLYESYINNERGLPYKRIVATETDAKVLIDRREDYIDPNNKFLIPNDIYILTAFVDAQAGSQVKPARFEGEVWGWGYGEECWIVDKFIIEGSPEDRRTHQKLKEWFFPEGESRTYKRKDGYELNIRRTGFDSGWATQSIYELCERMWIKGREWGTTKGVNRYGAPLLPRKLSIVNKAKTVLLQIGSQAAKAVLFERLNTIVEPGPRRIHHTKAYCDVEYFEQLTAEHAILKTIGLTQIIIYDKKKPNYANEAIDIWCGAYVMMKSLNIIWKKYKANIDEKVGALSNEEMTGDETQQGKSSGVKEAKPKSPVVIKPLAHNEKKKNTQKKYRSNVITNY
jgi:phage terminase large subunit GpA-like protein